MHKAAASLLRAAVAVLVLACGPTDSPDRAVPPHVFVIVVDALRADAVGFGGGPRDTTPKLDARAARGVVFEQATTPAGWTRPAVVSLMTGLYPSGHGVQNLLDVAPDDLEMLAEVFRDAGWETAAFVANFNVEARFGVMQGFDRVVAFRAPPPGSRGSDAPPKFFGHRRGYASIAEMDPEVRAFIAGVRDRPVFAYVHTMDPHWPYLPPTRYLRGEAGPRERYDAEVRYTDEYLGGWLDLLEHRGLFDESIVVLTADHGEEFLEHGGTGHGVTLFAECARVPLVVWAPGAAPGRRREQVSLADLAPTLLEAANVARPEGFARHGRSFFARVRGGAASAEHWNSSYQELVLPSTGVAFAYREDGDRLVHVVRDKTGRRDETFLYDVEADPGEQRDRSEGEPELTSELLRRIHERRAVHAEGAPGVLKLELDAEAEARLRALGYAESLLAGRSKARRMTRRAPSSPRPRTVHPKLRHAGPEGRQSAAREAGVTE